MMSCGQFNMLRMAPSSIMAIIPPSSKPKIGFSIDSIVGNSEFRGHGSDLSCFSPRSESPDRPSSSLSDYSYPLELRNSDSQIQSNSIHINEITTNRRQTMAPTSDFHRNFTVNMPECSPNSQDSIINLRQIHSNSPTRVQSPLSPQVPERPVVLNRTPSPPLAASILKCPIIVPGIPAGLIRPFPIQQPNSEIKHHIPPYFNTQDMIGSPNPHILAAQFQMAAALAHGQTNQIFSSGSGLHNHHHHHHHHPQFSNHSLVRDSYPLYPWLISRHGRIFPHRIPGNFLLQPFRKPKRVRTAFSPSQLLKLEHAFENNHYVVGAERKSLAQTLSLTETQVKVWFQNRRTKHKRMQQEEDAKNCGSNNGGNDNGDQKNFMGDSSTQASFDEEEDEDEDELIDMDDCSSDQECDQIQ